MSVDNKHKHLEFLQIVITRMAVNSFLLKGWTVTLLAAVFALAAKDTNPIYIVVAYFPVLIFWVLDGYYLYQERLFRSLYNHVRKQDEKDIDYSMNTTPFKYENGNIWIDCIFSITPIIFYGSLLVIVGFIMHFIR